MKIFSDILTPRGRLKIVEKVARKMNVDQQLSNSVLNLRLKLDAVRGANVHPGRDHEQIVNCAKSCSLTHLRAQIFTDHELLMNTSEWQDKAKRLIEDASPQRENDQTFLTPEFVRQCIAIYGNNPHAKPSTPPFTVVSGIKRSALYSRATSSFSVEPISTDTDK